MAADDVTTPLDEAAREELREYIHTSEQVEMWEERKRKARDALVAYLASRQADVGTLEDKPACRYTRRVRESVDSRRLKEEEPFLYRRFLRRSEPFDDFRLISSK